MNVKINGNLIIIGGAEDKEGDKEILKRLVSYLDKKKDMILIATIATEEPEKSYKKYRDVFLQLGIINIRKLDISTREDACNEKYINLLRKANLLFFTGGDQLRITSILGGTLFYDALKEFCNNGGLIAGTSAGASVMSDTMIINGKEEESPKKFTLKMSPGLGLIENVIIDQHFDQRGRIGRLLSGVAQNPEVLGIGIDEDTAIIVNNKGMAEIVGSGAVYFIDGSNISHSNVSEIHSNDVLSIFDVKLHVLKEGNRFDLLKKLPFEEEKVKNENNK